MYVLYMVSLIFLGYLTGITDFSQILIRIFIIIGSRAPSKIEEGG